MSDRFVITVQQSARQGTLVGNIGGAEEDRTPDLLRARQALSQLSYGPVSDVAAQAFHPMGETDARQPANNLPTTLVGLGGVEPPTSPLSGVRSNQLSYRPKPEPGSTAGRQGGASHNHDI